MATNNRVKTKMKNRPGKVLEGEKRTNSETERNSNEPEIDAVCRRSNSRNRGMAEKNKKL